MAHSGGQAECMDTTTGAGAEVLMNNFKKIYLLHCFPAPYRNHLFKVMNQEASKRGIKFIVQFYAEYDESRPFWRFKSEDLEYEHHFWKLNYKQ